MKRMTNKQYIEKLEEYVRELPDIDEASLNDFKIKAKTSIKGIKSEVIFLAGMEQGLELAIRTREEL
jgi:hypothetical protein